MRADLYEPIIGLLLLSRAVDGPITGELSTPTQVPVELIHPTDTSTLERDGHCRRRPQQNDRDGRGHCQDPRTVFIACFHSPMLVQYAVSVFEISHASEKWHGPCHSPDALIISKLGSRMTYLALKL